jgi:hypothetical protein
MNDDRPQRPMPLRIAEGLLRGTVRVSRAAVLSERWHALGESQREQIRRIAPGLGESLDANRDEHTDSRGGR